MFDNDHFHVLMMLIKVDHDVKSAFTGSRFRLDVMNYR